jgi:ubiquinone/menaquinone biosynthesis C-methylase UbiE
MPHGRTQKELDTFIKKLEQQTLETAEERYPIYIKAGLKDATCILDVGCGPGGVTKDIANHTNGEVYAIDDSPDMIENARKVLQGHAVKLCVGDAQHLPFKDELFDISICNLVLMWAPNPQQVIKEMTRVVKKGGKVVASLEPDFGGKIHWPENKKIDKIFAGAAIKKRGGDPHIGRKLRNIFVKAGLKTHVGLGNQRIWSCQEDKASYLRSKKFYWSALQNNGLTKNEIKKWENEYLISLKENIQFNFFPQFYAIGQKK